MTEPTCELPYDVDIETAVLATLIVDNSKIDIVSADLEAGHFYDALHQRLYQIIVALSAEGAVTPLIVYSVMKSDVGLKSVGGKTYLFSIIKAAPVNPDILAYVRVLKEHAKRRELVRIGQRLVEAVMDTSGSKAAQALADEATESLLQLGRTTAKPILSAQDIAMESLREIEAMANGVAVPLIKTGLHKIDKELGGFRGGDLVVIAGKAGQGKSAVMGTLSLNSSRVTVPTIVFSLEMTRRQWVERMACDIDFDTAEKPMWYSRIRNGRLNDDEFSRFTLAAQRLPAAKYLEIHDDGDLTVQQISSQARAFAAKHKGTIGLVVVDYLQIISPGDTRERNREQAVNSFARGMKTLAKRLNWVVVAGSQMNEGDEQRAKEERRPRASDVRESKGIMNEADIILSPYRKAWYVENNKPTDSHPGEPSWLAWKAELSACIHNMDILCLKNRSGRRFDTSLYCDMGASAIRDEPHRSGAITQAERDLLAAI